LLAHEDIMNIHGRSGDAERAQSEGNAIYEKLLPAFKQQNLKPGLFVAIDIGSGKYVVAETCRQLMISYKANFGHATGWVRRIEYS
jgi:hypothetical protein